MDVTLVATTGGARDRPRSLLFARLDLDHRVAEATAGLALADLLGPRTGAGRWVLGEAMASGSGELVLDWLWVRSAEVLGFTGDAAGAGLYEAPPQRSARVGGGVVTAIDLNGAVRWRAEVEGNARGDLAFVELSTGHRMWLAGDEVRMLALTGATDEVTLTEDRWSIQDGAPVGRRTLGTFHGPFPVRRQLVSTADGAVLAACASAGLLGQLELRRFEPHAPPVN